jgi:2-polyprenyl-3-methyl-5-hydroxy-6-metoxy-1,4-benzoquinol methylase
MTSHDEMIITSELIRQTHSEVTHTVQISDISSALEVSADSIEPIFKTAIAESLQTLTLLTGLKLPQESRILEVGAGYGFASICLAKMGFSVTALEPGGIGFEDNRIVAQVMAAKCDVAIETIDESAETKDFSQVQPFDLILSNNVVEHIANPSAALTNLYGVLSSNGFMIHSCANYAFPYEPHFGIPLFPVVPQLTRYMIPKKIRTHGVWRSLNFVTARDIQKICLSSGAKCTFRKGTMTTSISRLQTDFEFASRHKRLQQVTRIPVISKLLTTLFNLPVIIATPMDFVICHPESSSVASIQNWLKGPNT